MARRIELGSAALCGVTALLWLIYVNRIVGDLTQASGPTGQQLFSIDSGLATAFLVGTGLLAIGVAFGAYLHGVRGVPAGAILVLTCAGLLVVDIGAYEFTGWDIVPTIHVYPLNLELYTGVTVPTFLPVLEVLVVAFAIVAALASVTPDTPPVKGERRAGTRADIGSLPEADYSPS